MSDSYSKGMQITLDPPPDPSDRRAIARRMRILREYSGLSQKELSRQLGLGDTGWNNYERAVSRPPIDTANKLIQRFRITMDWIYRGDLSQVPYDVAIKLQELSTHLR